MKRDIPWPETRMKNDETYEIQEQQERGYSKEGEVSRLQQLRSLAKFARVMSSSHVVLLSIMSRLYLTIGNHLTSCSYRISKRCLFRHLLVRLQMCRCLPLLLQSQQDSLHKNP